jgi:hypothetical protein
MLISGREARALLEQAGFSSRHARTALSSGLVGSPIRTTAAHLYDEARVREVWLATGFQIEARGSCRSWQRWRVSSSSGPTSWARGSCPD